MHHSSRSYMSNQSAIDEEGKRLVQDSDQPLSDVSQLPKGAAQPGYMSQPSRSPQARDETFSPPATPNQRLLEEPEAQFASYPPSDKIKWVEPEAKGLEPTESWIPYPLRPWFWIPFFVFLVLLAIGLEIALHFSSIKNGWTAHAAIDDDTAVFHYVYTLPPSFAAMILVALWAWTDIEIKKMQPYVDLVHGDSPPHRSLLLDYTRSNNFIVWTQAARNKHYLVALSTLMVLLSLTFQPLAGALLIVNNTWFQLPDVTVQNTAHLGLNNNSNFQDLTAFLTAAGFASSSSLYNVPNPPFISKPYTIGSFAIPTGIQPNGTVLFANTTALKSNPGCQNAPVNMSLVSTGVWNNSLSVQGCSLQWTVSQTADLLFGTNTTSCTNNTPAQFSPVVFWFFQYVPTPMASAAICFPTYELLNVEINYDLAAQNVTHVTELGGFTSSSNFSSGAGNITGSPLFGRAYNGIQFNLTNPDPFTLAKQAAIQVQMPAAVLQKAEQSPAGVAGAFTTGSFVSFSTDIYTTYLTLLAQTVYFIPSSELNTLQVKSVVPRVFLSPVSVHLLAIGLILLAIFGTIAQLLHRFDRRKLHLRHQPGTIASAVSIGGQTGMGELLAGRQDQKDIDEVLYNKKFRIDPKTMKIIMEGEDGYEFAASPGVRRQSVFGALQNVNRKV